MKEEEREECEGKVLYGDPKTKQDARSNGVSFCVKIVAKDNGKRNQDIDLPKSKIVRKPHSGKQDKSECSEIAGT